MNIKFEVMDKTKRRLRMTDFNWLHISKKHPEISSQKEMIIESLENPDKIIESLKDKDTKFYYKYYKNLTSSYRFLKTVVKYLNGHGFIISSHLVKAIR